MRLRKDRLAALRLMLRATALLLLFAAGLFLELLYRLLLGREWYLHPAGRAIIASWMRCACRTIGLRIDARSQASRNGTLLVANHVSWLDILVINSLASGVGIAKSEVRSWPVIGTLAAMCGTRFIERQSLAGLNLLIEDLGSILRRGGQVILFPEGTSSEGDGVKAFSSALFTAAISAPARVQALAIEYRRDGALDPLAPFVGEDRFLPHLIRILREPQTCARVSFSAPLQARDHKRQDLARITRDQIIRQLLQGRPRQDTRTGEYAA